MDDERPVSSGLFCLLTVDGVLCGSGARHFYFAPYIPVKEKPPRLPAAVSWKDASDEADEIF
jgi:hypothetical protein